MEILDIVNERGEPTGKTVERVYAHENGIRHRTAHVWVYTKEEGKTWLLLQKRCQTKDSYPGCYDISSAGHIPAGVDYVPSALRELKEELGVEAEETELIFCGLRTVKSDSVFHGRPYHDRQVSGVYVYRAESRNQRFLPQPEEIESVMWMEYEKVLEGVKNNAFPHCIETEELRMIQNPIGK